MDPRYQPLNDLGDGRQTQLRRMSSGGSDTQVETIRCEDHDDNGQLSARSDFDDAQLPLDSDIVSPFGPHIETRYTI
jgi:hypothetical protein